MARIGVFVCHCGENIGRTVDAAAVAAAASKFSGVVHAVDYKYMCSDPGQNLIRQAIKEKRLTGVVVAACSPRMHEPTFRRATAESGVNPFLCEMANVREHCSWVHENREEATAKAIDLVRVIVEKVKRNQPLVPIKVPVTRRALVIGGGIAGIQAALDIANGGHEVILVEKDPSIGGHMAQLSETFPTLDCSQCILTPRMVEVAQHPKIKLYVYSEVEEVKGFIGNFEVKIRRKATSVNNALCTGCGACQAACVVKKVPSEFNRGLGSRTAIYSPFLQAVPNKPVIDQENCLRYKAAQKKGIPPVESTVCGKCLQACPIAPQKAVDFSLWQDTFVTEKVGAIVVATGFDLPPLSTYGEYGAGKYADVIDGMQFERLASASGPTQGAMKRPSDGKEPKEVVFIQCVGSRDNARGCAYCSKICCMYTAKHTMLYKHKVHDGKASVFYMDVRAAGKDYDEFWRRAVEEDGAQYLRGRVSKVYKRGDKLIVKGVDTLSGELVEIKADMVVLATAIVAQRGAERLAQRLSIAYDMNKFLSEAHPKLRPVETNTAGIFLAGACQAPKDIPDTVAQASGAASKVQGLFSSQELARDPTVAHVNEAACVACWYCADCCPYGAIEKKEIRDKKGNLIKMVASVNEGVCQGCGLCAATCRSKSVELDGFKDEQVYAEIVAL
ncbi:MAG: CoB--CoM heterodisulfide reductase iron-sulfur subunit A family protein [Planctomycetota bacterium]|nr:CoB--CoM heterodisulfide reductase iron-sulfur subunit A family protein [Planctomycetota bacterium]